MTDPLSDDGLALRFAAEHVGRLRHCAERNRWFEWDGARWREERTLHAFDLARAICREAADGIGLSNTPDPRRLLSRHTVVAVEGLSRTDRRLALTADQFDSDPWLLNTPGGVVDLRNGDLLPHSPAYLMTKVTSAEPAGSCPLWEAFLSRVTDGDVQLQRYLQRVAGYALTGDVSAHAMWFAFGTGANGKSVFIETLAGLMGDYAVTAPVETFTASPHDRHPTELAMLSGARLVTANETEEGRAWAEARVKLLTGGDAVRARFMRQDFFQFRPQFKLIVIGNHRPALRSVDEAIKRRFNLIHFGVTIPEEERDEGLREKLKAEWPGILVWAIQGCLDWQRGGLQAPEIVRNATAAYLEDEDLISQWIHESCEVNAGVWESPSVLFANWRMWAETQREEVGSMKSFRQKLAGRGFSAGPRSAHSRSVQGLRLRRGPLDDG